MAEKGEEIMCACCSSDSCDSACPTSQMSGLSLEKDPGEVNERSNCSCGLKCFCKCKTGCESSTCPHEIKKSPNSKDEVKSEKEAATTEIKNLTPTKESPLECPSDSESKVTPDEELSNIRTLDNKTLDNQPSDPNEGVSGEQTTIKSPKKVESRKTKATNPSPSNPVNDWKEIKPQSDDKGAKRGIPEDPHEKLIRFVIDALEASTEEFKKQMAEGKRIPIPDIVIPRRQGQDTSTDQSTSASADTQPTAPASEACEKTLEAACSSGAE